MVMPADQPWTASREEFKQCFCDLNSSGQAAAQKENMTQCSDKSLHLYIYRYTMHYATTNKTAQENMYHARSLRLLASINVMPIQTEGGH